MNTTIDSTNMQTDDLALVEPAEIMRAILEELRMIRLLLLADTDRFTTDSVRRDLSTARHKEGLIRVHQEINSQFRQSLSVSEYEAQDRLDLPLTD